METTENNVSSAPLKKVYSEEEFDEYRKNLEKEFLEKQEELRLEMEKESQKANMSELELALSELDELKIKYQQKEDECLIAEQKKETEDLLNEFKLGKEVLDIVYVEKDMEKTKEKIKTLKDYLEGEKKKMFEENINTPLPLTSSLTVSTDAFIQGFDSNKL